MESIIDVTSLSDAMSCAAIVKFVVFRAERTVYRILYAPEETVSVEL